MKEVALKMLHRVTAGICAGEIAPGTNLCRRVNDE